MKTMNKKNLLGAGMAIAIAFAAWFPGTAQAQDATPPMKPMKGGEHLMMLNQITTKEQADALKPDDSIAMVCAKCKTVSVSRVKQGEKGAQILMERGQPTELIGTHSCPGCGGTWTITGVGKGANAVLKHTCTMCGDDSGFCCATTTSGAPTKGMEKQ